MRNDGGKHFATLRDKYSGKTWAFILTEQMAKRRKRISVRHEQLSKKFDESDVKRREGRMQVTFYSYASPYSPTWSSRPLSMRNA